jgi:phosphate/sulfate permease
LLPPAVGSIIGFAFAFGGTNAVLWARPDPRSFPPYRGIVPIVLSWVVSPVLTGAVAAGIFGIVRWTVLRRENAAKLAFWVLPPAVVVTVMINVFFVCEWARGLRGVSDILWKGDLRAPVGGGAATSCDSECHGDNLL